MSLGMYNGSLRASLRASCCTFVRAHLVSWLLLADQGRARESLKAKLDIEQSRAERHERHAEDVDLNRSVVLSLSIIHFGWLLFA